MTFLGVAILALLAGLITVVVNAGRHRESLDARNVRRVFQYAVLYALVVVSAIGATELLGRLLGAEAPAWQDDSYALAQALTFVLVGVPLAALLAWAGLHDAATVDLTARREADLNRLADSLEAHLDLARLAACFGPGAAFDTLTTAAGLLDRSPAPL